MAMYKVCIIGHFAYGKNCLDGQTIKTKTLYQELERKYGKESIKKIDTFNWKKNIIKLLLNSIMVLKKCENLIMLPGYNAFRFLIPLFSIINLLYHRKLHYVVIGGWLNDELKTKKNLKHFLKSFKGIYVETYLMKENLRKLGFINAYYLPNFKRIEIMEDNICSYNYSMPYKLCTFSRIMEEKGIEDAIYVVKTINENACKVVFKLDIYGQVDVKYKVKFDKIRSEFPYYIRYKGKVGFNKSTRVIKDYLLLLFPTRYKGEGFAGTILDAFGAGVPVLASDWKYNKEIVQDKVNGFIYNAYDNKEIISILNDIVNGKYDICKMKQSCILAARKYSPDITLNCLLDNL